MLTNFMLILNFFVVLSLHFDRSASESGAHEFVDQTYLRQERIDAGVCEGKFVEDLNEDINEKWDLCFPIPDNTSVVGRDTHCLCDDNCVEYNECCVDKSIDESILMQSERWSPKSQSCIELISNGNPVISVYGIDKCDDNWIETSADIKNKCELNAQQFQTSGKMYSYIQDIPVLSQNFIYRNIFCAVCNNDSNNLKKWNISVDCEGELIPDSEYRNNMSPENYNPLTKKWELLLNNNQSINCSIGVQQFKDINFQIENNLRKCKNTINKCPANFSNTSVVQKCESYASYIYYENKIYKNYHCALCNGLPMEYVDCFPKIAVIRRTDASNTLWFPLLLDFNFAGDRGEWIGGKPKCLNSSQLYDPLYDRCVTINCKHKSSDNKYCVLNDLRSDDSKCFADLLLEENIDFVIFENNSIYNNRTKSFVEEDHQLLGYQTLDNHGSIEDKSIRKLKICRNESHLSNNSFIQSPFDVSFGQILLSEISIYSSIVCLTLHLMIYSLVPKLQNLPGKNLMSLSGALLLGHIFFVIGAYLRADRKIVCVLIAITTHYAYLAAFFWMSIMAFDVCKTFRRTSRRSKGSNRYKFLKYSLFGWLSPAFIVIISSAFDIALEGSKFRPLYGHRFCWISQRQALLAFFALPVGVIVCLNIFLFSMTAKGLIQTEEQTKILNKKSDKIRYFLYIKLSFLMGLTWIFGFAASLTDWKICWYPFIILNGLQGTVIFIAFSCKKKVFKLLAEKIGFKTGYERSNTTNTDVIRSATGSSLQTSTLVPNSPDSNVTKINLTNK